MKKKEIISNYLPFGLNILKNGKIKIMCENDLTQKTQIFKPILRPFEDLINLIQIEKYSIIPLETLANKAMCDLILSSKAKVNHKYCNSQYLRIDFEGYYKHHFSIVAKENDISFLGWNDTKDFQICLTNHFGLVNYLLKNHFDIFHLIEKKSAVDFNTIFNKA